MTLTRFAPAPTGFLHLGHVLNAKYVWDLARQYGARVLLRIEDHDRGRCRPEYERAILEDLDWLGFVPDVYPTDEFRAGPCASRQSDRHDIYVEAARDLNARGLLYGCRAGRLGSSAITTDFDNPTTRKRRWGFVFSYPTTSCHESFKKMDENERRNEIAAVQR